MQTCMHIPPIKIVRDLMFTVFKIYKISAVRYISLIIIIKLLIYKKKSQLLNFGQTMYTSKLLIDKRDKFSLA